MQKLVPRIKFGIFEGEGIFDGKKFVFTFSYFDLFSKGEKLLDLLCEALLTLLPYYETPFD
jgi:hypothetical protein